MNEPTSSQVLDKALAALGKNAAVQLATTGHPEYSPWILGAYYVNEGPDLLLFLETGGKSLRNVQLDPRVAFSVSENDAMKDFLQGRGEAKPLPASEYDAVLAKLTAKLPWFKLYTPSTPVRVVTRELLVSSLESQWFPAKRWAR